jgi:hypothetical protein
MRGNTMETLSINFAWRSNGSKLCCEKLKIHSKHEYSYYGRLEDDYVSRSVEDANRRKLSAQGIIRFMDATGLRRSEAVSRVFKMNGSYPGEFDHLRVWKNPVTKRFLVTADPYDGCTLTYCTDWCVSHDWEYKVFPKGFGLWYPPYTRLVLASPPGIGADIASLSAKLTDCMEVAA